MQRDEERLQHTSSHIDAHVVSVGYEGSIQGIEEEAEVARCMLLCILL